MAEEKQLDLDIQVDGGIGTDNVKTVSGSRSEYNCSRICSI